MEAQFDKMRPPHALIIADGKLRAWLVSTPHLLIYTSSLLFRHIFVLHIYLLFYFYLFNLIISVL